jgi:hypothetical protein
LRLLTEIQNLVRAVFQFPFDELNFCFLCANAAKTESMNPMELTTCLACFLHGAAMASNKSSSCQGTECQCCCGNVFYQRVPVFLQDTRRYADEESDARYRVPAASSTDAHASKRRSAEEEELAALKAKKLHEQEIEDQRLVRRSSPGTIPFTSLISTFA